MRSRSVARVPDGTRSSSWRLTPYAPSCASWCTALTGSSAGRTGSPNGSRPTLPTVQRPNGSDARGAARSRREERDGSWDSHHGVAAWFAGIARTAQLPVPVERVRGRLVVGGQRQVGERLPVQDRRIAPPPRLRFLDAQQRLDALESLGVNQVSQTAPGPLHRAH